MANKALTIPEFLAEQNKRLNKKLDEMHPEEIGDEADWPRPRVVGDTNGYKLVDENGEFYTGLIIRGIWGHIDKEMTEEFDIIS
ncbi:MAG: hypothetical protein AAFR28_18690 [Pseudomonadota bacterium]